MSKKNYHVVPRGGNWAVKGAGNQRATHLVSTQAEAIKIARDYACKQASELCIHRPNGQIREKWSYGNDPHPPKG
ncbi:MAG: DUF2188 domain-containing protein [Saprospiraceae bacterium]